MLRYRLQRKRLWRVAAEVLRAHVAEQQEAGGDGLLETDEATQMGHTKHIDDRGADQHRKSGRNQTASHAALGKEAENEGSDEEADEITACRPGKIGPAGAAIGKYRKPHAAFDEIGQQGRSSKARSVGHADHQHDECLASDRNRVERNTDLGRKSEKRATSKNQHKLCDHRQGLVVGKACCHSGISECRKAALRENRVVHVDLVSSLLTEHALRLGTGAMPRS